VAAAPTTLKFSSASARVFNVVADGIHQMVGRPGKNGRYRDFFQADPAMCRSLEHCCAKIHS